MKANNTVKLNILDRDYNVACPADAESELREAAQQLHNKMTEIKQSGKVFGVERIAVMAALNLIHELRQQQQANVASEDAVTRIIDKIDAALDSSED